MKQTTGECGCDLHNPAFIITPQNCLLKLCRVVIRFPSRTPAQTNLVDTCIIKCFTKALTLSN